MLDAIQASSFWETIPDLEIVTLCVRLASINPDEPDTFTSYTLFHVKRWEADRGTFQEMSTESLTFHVYQDDLTASGLANPQPYVSYLIIDQTAGTFTANSRANSDVLSSLANTSGLRVGMGVVAGNVTPGSTIVSVGTNQLTLSQAATATLTAAPFTAGDAWVVESATRNKTKARWELKCAKAH